MSQDGRRAAAKRVLSNLVTTGDLKSFKISGIEDPILCDEVELTFPSGMKISFRAASEDGCDLNSWLDIFTERPFWQREITRLILGMGASEKTAEEISRSPWVVCRHDEGATPDQIVKEIRGEFRRYSEDRLILETVKNLWSGRK
jgi:hypothetical protein